MHVYRISRGSQVGTWTKSPSVQSAEQTAEGPVKVTLALRFALANFADGPLAVRQLLAIAAPNERGR